MKQAMLLAGLLVILFWCAQAMANNPVPAPAPASAQDAHAQLNEILHRPMYSAWRLRELHDTPTEDTDHRTSDRWLRYLSKKIEAIRDWFFPSKDDDKETERSSGIGVLPHLLKGAAWIITIVGLGFILVLIIQMIRGNNVTGVSAHILSRQQIQKAMEAGDALALNSSEWLDEAQRLAADQNFRMVYRALYLALLSGLHSAGKIDHNPNRTNWTYVQNYRGPGDERDHFSKLTDLFDRVWYGHKNPGSENLSQLRETVRTLTRTGASA
ncbi:MAG TPA: DUF4129 domain-containing protein [Tepidisphaeraceae bacterium]|jgi:hypothetical protein